jgi:hypothetical protein
MAGLKDSKKIFTSDTEQQHESAYNLKSTKGFENSTVQQNIYAPTH